MYLKRLELQGFKSFPEKVRLEFNKGITAVVGPNGSGKSNISDAVRWVLGEQRAKSLRGDKMEDVIFAGTQNRRPVGFAEVSITIDNQDHKMPIEYTDVTVTRRVFRSGDSEYLINGTNCRLKDIYELFMDTGVGREGYSIIGQGRIDEILSSKSEDRRHLFEEAVGIVKYKNRRQDALGKLEKEHQNLIRITDIISEIDGQMESLEIQSEKAKEYLAIRDRLKNAEIGLFKIKGQQLSNEIKNLEENLKITKESLIDEEKKQETLGENSIALKKAVENITSEVQVLNNDIVEIRSEIEKNDGMARLTNEQIKNIDTNIQRLNSQIDIKNASLNGNADKVEFYKTKLIGVDFNITSENGNLLKKEEKLNEKIKLLSNNETQVEDYKTEMIEKIKVTTDIKGNLQKVQSMLEQFENRYTQLLSEKTYLESQSHDAYIHLEVSRRKAEQSELLEKEAQEEIECMIDKKKRIIAAITKIDSDLQEKTKFLNEKKSRHKVLSDMEKEHDGFFKSVKYILKSKESGDSSFGGIRGAIGQLLHVDEKYETAIEIALGSNMQSIVSETEDDAKTAIEYLKINNLGRATFFPISAIKAKEMENEKKKFMKEKGAIGFADELVEYENEYKGIVSNLLGRTLVVENIDSAIFIAKKYKHSQRIVTVEGDIFQPGGSMTGGSIGKKASSIFGRTRELAELQRIVSESETIVGALEAQTQKYKKEIEDINFDIEEKKMDAQNEHINFLTASQDFEHTNSLILSQDEKIKLFNIEKQQLEEQKEKAVLDMLKSQERLGEIENEIARIENMVSGFRDSLQSERDERDNLLEEITAIKIKISSLSHEKDDFMASIRRIDSETRENQKEISKMEHEISDFKEEKYEKEKNISIISEKNHTEKGKALRLQNLLEEKTELRKKTAESISLLEDDIQNCYDTCSKYNNNIFRIETKMDSINTERQKLFQEMWEEYEITFSQAMNIDNLEKHSDSMFSKEVKELKTQMKALGSVNVNAVSEFLDMKKRFDFLSAQKEDIIKTEDKLGGIIKELSELMETQFKEQFQLISENFNTVFCEMFGGGKAYLKLNNQDNVLESGIEIIAQPPGKNLQNMMLLSGGERALTAIAILFSILKMKPSPFCILDEIEAALDDANVRRFGNYLKKFSGDTQFIVITHRKGTMESADVMYGVTMQEHGISKIVSVKFDEEAV